tara:strand:+ start:174 stop:290 length:117 start_codon:yes stop_codon:yes gene_type:complete
MNQDNINTDSLDDFFDNVKPIERKTANVVGDVCIGCEA